MKTLLSQNMLGNNSLHTKRLSLLKSLTLSLKIIYKQY